MLLFQTINIPIESGFHRIVSFRKKVQTSLFSYRGLDVRDFHMSYKIFLLYSDFRNVCTHNYKFITIEIIKKNKLHKAFN